MPNVTLVFFLLLIPLSGFIAWAGDRIGHKSGKKRHSLFGLRPRHTAMVFTIGSGMLTALVSFGLFFLFSETFRIVVRDGAEMYGTNRRLKAENHFQFEALQRSQESARKVNDEIKKLDAERDAAQAASAKVLAELQAVETKRKTAEARAASAQNNYAEAQNGLKEAQKTLELASNDLRRVRGDLSRKTAQAQSADERRRQAEARVRRAENEVKVASGRAKKARTEQKTAQAAVSVVRDQIREYRNMNKTLLGQTNKLIDDAKKLQDELTDRRKQSQGLALQASDLRTQVAALNTERQRAEREVRLLRENASALRSGRIAYQVGEEVDRLAIPPGHSVWRIKAILSAFLNSAAKKAEARGAARGDNPRAVLMATQPYTGAGQPVSDRAQTPRNVKVYTEENAIGDAAELIRRTNEETVIVASATANAIAGETVPVRFHVYRNPVVLKTDTKLGELSVNGDGTRQEISDRLYTFLSRDIHRKLIEGGIIPHQRGEDVPGGDPLHMAEQFTLSGDEFISLMDDVRRAGPRAKVVVYPARNLRAGDTPALRFDVKHPLIQAPAFLRDIK